MCVPLCQLCVVAAPEWEQTGDVKTGYERSKTVTYNLLIRHQVADYNRWKPLFDEHAENRKSHGSNGGILFRNADNENELIAIWTFDSVDHARAFTQDPSLREAMGRAGVIDRPDLYFLNEVEHVPV
jgi:hypothetical protein